MAAIAERLAVVPRTVTDVVDGVEAAGLVVRRADPDDRRATFVALTPAGRQLLDRLDTVRRESAEQVFGRLRSQELATLHALLLELDPPSSDQCLRPSGDRLAPQGEAGR
jgi:DNA-binding MarR family transcriptional regulator